MPQGIRWIAWLRHIAVMVAYALAYVGLRHIGGINWVPLAGLRLICLLLFPYRYWPALLVGEIVPLAYINYSCISTAGINAYMALTVPPLGLAMPVVVLMRKCLPSLGQAVDSRIGALLLCASIVSTIWSIDGFVYYALLENLPPGESPISWSVLGYTYFLACYLGVLVVVPPVLAMVYGLAKAGSWRGFLALLPRERLFWHSVALLLGMGAMVAVGIHTKNEHWHIALLIVFFVPVIFFALRHGWQGAAIAGTCANIGIVWIMPAWNDFVTMVAQTILVLVMIMFLMLGALTSDLNQALRKTRESLWAATHDMLTGLPNRVLFQDHLHTARQRVTRGGDFALALVDLDGFKAVNDQHGHLIGDALLQAVAMRLTDGLRGNDTVARLGGDEFALILEDITDVTSLLQRCQQLADALAMPYALAGQPGDLVLQVSASIGIAFGASCDNEQLIQAADQALYQAKKAGKNRCVLADTTITALPFVSSSRSFADTES